VTPKSASPQFNLRTLFTLIAAVVAAVLATLAVLYATGQLAAATPNRQQMVHSMGAGVMPFDLDKTTHIFTMTPSGGVQQVVAKDPAATDQIVLIQQHLQHEAQRFSAGDFGDPVALHGGDMPGLKELAAGAARITVTHTPLPNGAQLTYTTTDLQLITALHQWFGAQLSDHGHDAIAR